MKSLKNFRSNKSYRKRVYRIKSCRRLKERNHLERHRPIPNNSRRVKHHSPLYIILRSIFRVKIPSSQDYHSQHDEGKTRKGRNIPRDIRHPLPTPPLPPPKEKKTSPSSSTNSIPWPTIRHHVQVAKRIRRSRAVRGRAEKPPRETVRLPRPITINATTRVYLADGPDGAGTLPKPLPVCHGTPHQHPPPRDRNFDLTPIYRAATSRPRHTHVSPPPPPSLFYSFGLIVSKVRRSRSLRQWPGSSLSSSPPFSSPSSNRQSREAADS